MITEAPHFGTYIWTRPDGSTRPMSGSAAHDVAELEMTKKREQDFLTPEGQKWLEKHGAI